MANLAARTISTVQPVRSLEWIKQAALVIGASWFVAACAHITLPLPFTPVPLTLQNFGVLVVGLALGSRRGFAAMALYLVEGASGLPVFNPAGPGGIAQLLGPTGGYLMIYPLVAATAGLIVERGKTTLASATLAGIAAEAVLFAGGISWLAYWTHSLSLAFRLGFYAFIFAEIMKTLIAAAIATRLRRNTKAQV
jgi:biotin transport system substrate-specific component